MTDEHFADDEKRYRAYGEKLRVAVAAALPDWLDRLLSDRAGLEIAHSVEAQSVIDAVVSDALARIDALILADIETPISGPLELLRRSVEPVAGFLDSCGVAPPARNIVDVEMRPGDRHDLGPMTFLDLGPHVHDAGIAWGAAKAHMHLQRRSRPGASGSA